MTTQTSNTSNTSNTISCTECGAALNENYECENTSCSCCVDMFVLVDSTNSDDMWEDHLVDENTAIIAAEAVIVASEQLVLADEAKHVANRVFAQTLLTNDPNECDELAAEAVQAAERAVAAMFEAELAAETSDELGAKHDAVANAYCAATAAASWARDAIRSARQAQLQAEFTRRHYGIDA